MTKKKTFKPMKHRLPKTREEWLQGRTKGIGGSDAGAVIGVNPYKSRYALWCEKTGRVVNDTDNEAMRLGRDLESYVAQRFTEQTGKKVKASGYSFEHPDYSFMLANVDRLIVGEKAGLECKTTSALSRTKYDKGDIPASYYVQCMHYMAVTGLQKWYLAVLVLGKEFHVFEINRDEEEIQALIDAEWEFWDCVKNDIEPEVDGKESTSKAIADRYANVKQTDPISLEDKELDIQILLNLKKQIKELQTKESEYENILKNTLGESEYGFSENYKVSWKQTTTSRFDAKTFKQNHPGVYQEYCKESTSRRFTIKEIKDNDRN